MIFLVQYSGYQLGTAIKQADAVLLGFPLSLPMSRSTRANDLQLYAGSVRESGPAMTWAMHAIGQVGTSNHKQNYKNNTAAQLLSTSYQESRNRIGLASKSREILDPPCDINNVFSAK